MGIDEMKLVLLLAGLCGFAVMASPVVPMDNVDDSPLQRSLNADPAWRAAQESLKDAQALPSTNDFELKAAQQAAKIQANADKLVLTQKYAPTAVSLGEAATQEKPVHMVQAQTDALMGKMVMADMFSEQELDMVKSALNAKVQRLGESKQINYKNKYIALHKKTEVLKHSIEDAQHMAMGMQFQKKALKQAKASLTGAHGKIKTLFAKIKNTAAAEKKRVDMLKACQRNSYKKIHGLKVKHLKALDKMKKHIQLSNTKVQLSKRALQTCEAKNAGSSARATARVARRTNRAVKRAKRKMHKKAAKKAAKKAMKKKLKMQVKSKLKKKMKAKLAKKFKKLTKKKLSPKCKACMKLSIEEKRTLKVDCKAC